MATAKKAATKPVVKRRKPVEEAAPVAKRVVRRRKPVAEEPTNPAPVPVPETVAAEETSPLQTADIVDLRNVNIVGRFGVVLELQMDGYIFDGSSEKDATDMIELYTGFIDGLRLQHRNKLIFPICSMSNLQPHALITAPLASRVSAEVVMTQPSLAAPKELNLGGATYVKTSN